MDYYATDTPPPDATECFSSPNDQELAADFFIPGKALRNGAAVVFIHGGGWYQGKRQAFLWHAHRLSLRGYLTCTIDYRLAGTAIFPAPVADCQSAVKWLRRHAGRFNICSDRIGAFGSSAGGHLAACIGVLDDDAGDVSAKANCVVAVHGVHDFPALLNQGGKVKEKIKDICEALIGGPISQKHDQWINASPALRADKNSAPMLLTHDPQDETVPYEQSLRMANALMNAGRPVQFMPTPGSGHGFVYAPQNPWTQRVWPVAAAWFGQHLLGLRADCALTKAG